MNQVLVKLQGESTAERSWRAAEEMLRGTEINSGDPDGPGSKWRQQMEIFW